MKDPLKIPSHLSEIELRELFQSLGEKNLVKPTKTFAGAGTYFHYVPSIIDPLVGRGEFLTSYTPYQPELAQGTLMGIFEFQTFMANLTGLEISNASSYDGSTSAAEAMLMMNRMNGKNSFYISSALHPEVKEVIYTYASDLDFKILELPIDENLKTIIPTDLNPEFSGVLLQSPNFFGVMENIEKFAQKTKSSEQILTAIVLNAHSMIHFEAPGAQGADLVVGDCTGFGNFPNFGGPGVGFFTCKKDYLRNLPGRICGKTVDGEGVESFCLTLSTREQHIRREKATSNICSNQGLCALRVSIYCSLMGEEGLQKVAQICFEGARELRSELQKHNLNVYKGDDFFNEFFVEFKGAAKFVAETHKFIGGVVCTNPHTKKEGLLLTVTEMNRKYINEFVTELMTWRNTNV